MAIGGVGAGSKIYTSKAGGSDKPKMKNSKEDATITEGGDLLDGKSSSGVRGILRVVRRKDGSEFNNRNKTAEERALQANEMNEAQDAKSTERTDRVNKIRERFMANLHQKARSPQIRDVKPVMQKFPGLQDHYLMWPLRQKVRGWEIGPAVLLFTQGRKKRRLVLRGRRRQDYDAKHFQPGESFVIPKSVLDMLAIEANTGALTEPMFYPLELKMRQADYEAILEFPTPRLLRGEAIFPEKCDHFVESIVGNRNRVSSSALYNSNTREWELAMQSTSMSQDFLDREIAGLKIVPAPVDLASLKQDLEQEMTLLQLLRSLAKEKVLQTYQEVIFIPWPDDDPIEIELRRKNAKKV
jgi:hypothetical protein